jgi:phosphatidylserine decarboxylase
MVPSIETFGGVLLALGVALPLAWKWCLGVKRVGLSVLILGLVAGLAVSALEGVCPLGAGARALLVWLLTIGLAFATLAFRFYRDPERSAPARRDVVVSPADGEVIYVREFREGLLPVSIKGRRAYELHELTRTELQSRDATVIGVAMSFLDVHVNRAPIAGRITLQEHFSGRFDSLRKLEAVFENERATTVIERGDLQVAVVQIASRLVRQIVSFTRPGQAVGLGQRIGVIRLGSQVDLVLPARDDIRLAVQPGQRVTAGVTVVAVVEPKTVASAEQSALEHLHVGS